MKNIFKNRVTSKYHEAFTLIELLVVVAIISLLSSLVMSSLASARMKANDTKIAQDLRQFRNAVDLYYNDNHVYPPTDSYAVNYEDTKFANESNPQNSWAHKLSFFIKTAEAALQPTHSITALCKNFDNVAISMVNRKYLASVPVHPYDNDATGVCYKAVRSASTNSFSAYGILTSQVGLTNGTRISKRAGFIEGDVSVGGIVGIKDAITSTAPSGEISYPAGPDGLLPVDSSGGVVSIDQIDGLTSGSNTFVTNGSSNCPANQFYSNYTSSCLPVIRCSADLNIVYDAPTNSCKSRCQAGYHVTAISYPTCIVDDVMSPPATTE